MPPMRAGTGPVVRAVARGVTRGGDRAWVTWAWRRGGAGAGSAGGRPSLLVPQRGSAPARAGAAGGQPRSRAAPLTCHHGPGDLRSPASGRAVLLAPGDPAAAKAHSQGRSLRSRPPDGASAALDCDLPRQRPGTCQEDGGKAGEPLVRYGICRSLPISWP
jgi:hypothetical protein